MDRRRNSRIFLGKINCDRILFRAMVDCGTTGQGEHIHLGFYNDEDRRAVTIPWKSGKVFKETKYK